jgi:hypothetical protein
VAASLKLRTSFHMMQGRITFIVRAEQCRAMHMPRKADAAHL